MESGLSIAGISERVFAGKWIAGPNIKDAMRRTKELNARGMSTIINYIGEGFTDKRDVSDTVSTYLSLIKAITKAKAQASISLKITQLGLLISKNTARKNYDKIVSFARKKDVFVWLDMESHDTIDDTISIYKKQARRGGAGIALQCYLRRSERDLSRLAKKRGVVRLVKGAYKESEKIAFPDRKEVTHNYSLLMHQLFKNYRKFTIATHDSELIEQAMRLNRTYRRDVTYAMLNGIRNKYAERLAAGGNRVAIYVPFGSKWVEYASRRMKEATHVLLILRSLLGG